jgi:transcription-repair coupling factor (superfamily II helicase)
MEQSGHVATVGFYLYCKLLKRAVETLQGKAPSYSFEVKIETPYNAKFPENYVNNVQLRCELYQRLGEATTLDDVKALFDEVIDRFGRLPEPALWLRSLSFIRVLAATKGVTLLKIETQTVVIERKLGSRTASLRRLLPRVQSPEALQQALEKIFNELGSLEKREG